MAQLHEVENRRHVEAKENEVEEGLRDKKRRVPHGGGGDWASNHCARSVDKLGVATGVPADGQSRPCGCVESSNGRFLNH